ncbi:putative Na+/H+ antiporter [Rhodoferax ferrireducens]|uniref:putative Na+/H+ antiporter n=1 Tax=Rhodoferax ferrireducens TaxID=192843 RepID=UPI00298E7940|nr:putative Na+/H+ antiporter [Rhodoferax ferrireducens]WPC68315.1 putative Na+/H+ antiporter [Rhodoferax ferrireducens]
MNAIQWVGAGLFTVALVHTFSTKFFERMAHRGPDHAGMWHLLAEVEVVFGFWAMVLIVAMAVLLGRQAATDYLDSRNFTEPMFVFAIMVVAGSRAVLDMARASVNIIARFIPLSGGMAFYFVALAFVPLLGSLITEPAAMTLAALMLRDRIYGSSISTKLKYATLGVLFVNVSIGGTLTSFAAPPVLMVASKWNWDSWYMLGHFGWKAALAVGVNALVTTLIFKKELSRLPRTSQSRSAKLPVWVASLHILFLVGVVVFAHHPAVFMGLFLFFMGFATAYPQFQDRLILREGLLVAFFLAGLVVLGGQQQWWLEPLLRSMDSTTVYFGATALTAVTDNAALTYLGSLVSGLSDEFKHALVAGAVTGGGLTVIANAPNPAGFAILRGHFEDEAIHPIGLLVAALPPTLTAVLAFRLL